MYLYKAFKSQKIEAKRDNLKRNSLSLCASYVTLFSDFPLYYRNSRKKMSLTDDKIVSFATNNFPQVFWNLSFNKGLLKNFVFWCFINYGQRETIKILEKLQIIGFGYATKAGISLSIDDLKIPPTKAMLLADAEKSIEAGFLSYKKSQLTGLERFQRIIETWHKTSESLKDEMITNFRQTDSLNPVYMMAFSGARGNISQVRQLVAMRGLMSDPQGKILDFPIRSNFREGLTLTEYVISCYGARKGVVDTALRTANAGYLTRRLVDVAQHVIVLNFDCGTKKGFYLTEMKKFNKTLYPLRQRLLGRVLAANLYTVNPFFSPSGSRVNENEDLKNSPKGRIFISKAKEGRSMNSTSSVENSPFGTFKSHFAVSNFPTETQESQIVAFRNQEISEPLAEKISKITNKVFIRSPLTCDTPRLVCQLCYGWSLSEGYLVSIGEAVGIIAAQSIGEPGTQLTMRTFHTGGVFAGEMFDQLISPYDGIVQYSRSIPGTLVRTTQGKIAFLTKVEGKVSIFEKNNSSAHKSFKLPAYSLLFLRNNEIILKDQLIAELAFLSSKGKKKGEIAEFIVKSEMEGQLYSGSVNILEKYTDYNDIMTKSIDWGSVWILSGKICQLPVNSSFFALPGDLVDENAILSQIQWVAPMKSLLDTNSLIKHHLKKEIYFDFSLNQTKWFQKRNLETLNTLFNLKFGIEKKNRTKKRLLFREKKSDFFSFLKAPLLKNVSSQNPIYFSLPSTKAFSYYPFTYLSKMRERKFKLLSDFYPNLKKISKSFEKISFNQDKSLLLKMKIQTFSDFPKVSSKAVKKNEFFIPIIPFSKSPRLFPILRQNKSVLFGTSNQSTHLFYLKDKININLPLIFLNIDNIYYKKIGYFFSFKIGVEKRPILNRGRARALLPVKLSPNLIKLKLDQNQSKEKKNRASLFQRLFFSKAANFYSTVFTSSTFKNGDFTNFQRIILKSRNLPTKVLAFQKKSDFLSQTRAFDSYSICQDVFFVPKLLGQRKIISTKRKNRFKQKNHIANQLLHWFPKSYLTMKGGICVYRLTHDFFCQYINFQSLSFLSEKKRVTLRENVDGEINKPVSSNLLGRIFWVTQDYKKTKLYKLKFFSDSKYRQQLRNSPKTLKRDIYKVHGNEKQELNGKKSTKKENFSSLFCTTAAFPNFIRKIKDTNSHFSKYQTKHIKKSKDSVLSLNFYKNLTSYCFKNKSKNLTNFLSRKNSLKRESSLFFSTSFFCLQKTNSFKKSLTNNSIMNGFIYKPKNLVSAISLNKKFFLPGQKIVDDVSFDNFLIYVECIPEYILSSLSETISKTRFDKKIFFNIKKLIKNKIPRFIKTEQLLPNIPFLKMERFQKNKKSKSFFVESDALAYDFERRELKLSSFSHSAFFSPFVLLITKVLEYPLYEPQHYKKALYKKQKTSEQSFFHYSCKVKSKLLNKIFKNNYHSDVFNKQKPSLRLLDKFPNTDLVLALKYKGIQKDFLENFFKNSINLNLYIRLVKQKSGALNKSQKPTLLAFKNEKKILKKENKFSETLATGTLKNYPLTIFLTGKFSRLIFQSRAEWDLQNKALFRNGKKHSFFPSLLKSKLFNRTVPIFFRKSLSKFFCMNFFSKSSIQLLELVLVGVQKNSFNNKIIGLTVFNFFHKNTSKDEEKKKRQLLFFSYLSRKKNSDFFSFFQSEALKKRSGKKERANALSLPTSFFSHSAFNLREISKTSSSKASFSSFFHSLDKKIKRQTRKQAKFVVCAFEKSDFSFDLNINRKKKYFTMEKSGKQERWALKTDLLKAGLLKGQFSTKEATLLPSSALSFQAPFFKAFDYKTIKIMNNNISQPILQPSFYFNYYQKYPFEYYLINNLEASTPFSFSFSRSTDNFKNYFLFYKLLSIFNRNNSGKKLDASFPPYFTGEKRLDDKASAFQLDKSQGNQVQMYEQSTSYFSLISCFFQQPCFDAFFTQQVSFGYNELKNDNQQKLNFSKKVGKRREFYLSPFLRSTIYFKKDSFSEQGDIALTRYLSPFMGEILRHENYYWSQNTQKNRYLLLTKKDQISFFSNNSNTQKEDINNSSFFLLKTKKTTPNLGEFLTQGDCFTLKSTKSIISSESGLIVHSNKSKITLRKAQSFFLSPNCIFHYSHGDLVEKNKAILSLPYEQLKTGDIVQGIPKVEQLLEARSTFKGKEEEDNLHKLLRYVFELYKIKFNLKLSVRKSFSFIQLILVNSVQRIYRSQGVSISDKHLEVIVKQMTSKVQITSRGDSSFFRGEHVDLYIVETWNALHPQLKKICYKPILLGISRSSLEVNSFLSAASFQHTKKVLSRSAFKTNIDFLNGLKENVIIGNLISAGTGNLNN